jgi:leader peptidase (prepilin peptidase)/N-methyltransferase
MPAMWTASMVVDVMAVATAMLVAGGYAAFLAAWVSPRIRPKVPSVDWRAAAVVSALTAGALTSVVGPQTSFGVLGAIVPILLLAAFVDAKTLRIPNAYTVQAIFVALAASVWFAFEGLSLPAVGVSWLAAAATFVALLVVNVVSRGGLGMGDVKLASIMAAIICMLAAAVWGQAGGVPDAILLPLMLLVSVGWVGVSFVAGGVVVAVRATAGKRSAFPFGPCLVVGWIVSVAAVPFLPNLFL